MTATGKCLCGSVTFVAQGVDSHVHSCHCNMCRKWSGGPALAASVESVTFSGEEHITRYDSSEWAQRGFCSRCGTNLFYFLKPDGSYMMWGGGFDDPEQLALAGEIFVDEKPSTYNFAGDHPRLTGEEFMASLQPGADG